MPWPPSLLWKTADSVILESVLFCFYLWGIWQSKKTVMALIRLYRSSYYHDGTEALACGPISNYDVNQALGQRAEEWGFLPVNINGSKVASLHAWMKAEFLLKWPRLAMIITSVPHSRNASIRVVSHPMFFQSNRRDFIDNQTNCALHSHKNNLTFPVQKRLFFV